MAKRAAAVCVAFWALSLDYAAWALTVSLQISITSMSLYLLKGAFVACLPVAVLWDLADASSECDARMLNTGDP